MAAVTSAVIALGGLGLSAAQAGKANKDMKTFAKDSETASRKLKAINKEQNAFKNVQVPTLGFDLAQQAASERDISALNAIQGAGAAGVIGAVGQVAKAGADQDLQLAAAGQKAQYDRDLEQANAQQGINQRQTEMDFKIGMGEKQDAELRRSEAAARKTAAIKGIATSAGSALMGVAEEIEPGSYKSMKDNKDGSGDLAGDILGYEQYT